MDITVTITKDSHDCVLAQLRKKENGDDDLTVTEWVQGAIDGKVNKCMKRADPVAVLEAEKLVLEGEKSSLKSEKSALEGEKSSLKSEKSALEARVAELESA